MRHRSLLIALTMMIKKQQPRRHTSHTLSRGRRPRLSGTIVCGLRPMAATLARYLTGGGGAANPSSQETNAGAGAQAQQQQHVPATEAEMQQSAGAAGLNVRLQVLPDGARVVTRGAEGVAVAHVGAHTSTGRRASNEDRYLASAAVCCHLPAASRKKIPV